MLSDLKTCPFCNGEARMTRTRDTAQWWYVECGKCYSRQLASDTAQEAENKWNSRTGDAHPSIGPYSGLKRENTEDAGA